MSKGDPLVRILVCAWLGILCAGGSVLCGQTQPAEDLSLPPSAPLVLLAWSAPGGNSLTHEQYKEFAEAGFTHGLAVVNDDKEAKAALDLAETVGVKLMLFSGAMPLADIDGSVKGHPALGGYFIQDEPSTEEYAALSETIRQIRRRDSDPSRICLVNLFPSCQPGQMGVETYAEYVYRFAAEVPTEVLSYDCYPIHGHSVDPMWYKDNLDIAAGAARVAGKPLWVFIASVGAGKTKDPDDGGVFAIPSLGTLRLQAYTNLAYGAQGIEYWTYQTWDSPKPPFSKGAALDPNGHRTPTYDMIRQVNRELQAQAPVFVGSKAKSIGYAGESAPPGTRRYAPKAPVKSLQAGGKGAVVSILAKGDRRFLVIVNQDPVAKMPLSVAWEPAAHIGKVNKNGTVEAVFEPGLEWQVGPGDAAIFTWRQEPQTSKNSETPSAPGGTNH